MSPYHAVRPVRTVHVQSRLDLSQPESRLYKHTHTYTRTIFSR